MTAALFLAEPAAVRGLQAGATVTLDGAEGRHAVASRRLQPGEALDIGDGRGTLLRCRVARVTGRESLDATVESARCVPAPQPRLVVVQALPKGDRGETAVETMTEVGVDVIVPWAAHRCVTRWTGERASRGPSRWQGVARAAAKQARRPWLTEVAPLASTADVVALVRQAARPVVLHESATAPLGGSAWPTSGDVVLVVGPEGGLTDEEGDCLVQAGASLARMGPTVMRTSTAGTVASSVVLSATARWEVP